MPSKTRVVGRWRRGALFQWLILELGVSSRGVHACTCACRTCKHSTGSQAETAEYQACRGTQSVNVCVRRQVEGTAEAHREHRLEDAV